MKKQTKDQKKIEELTAKLAALEADKKRLISQVTTDVALLSQGAPSQSIKRIADQGNQLLEAMLPKPFASPNVCSVLLAPPSIWG